MTEETKTLEQATKKTKQRQRDHVVFIRDEDNHVRLVGSPRGTPLTEMAAKVLVKRYQQSTFKLKEVLALKIEPISSAQNVPIRSAFKK